ncbi:MAG: IS4 family transposase [Bacteroidota bacterium]|nr:IS4 family transposase [Bacteroidota bacterium]
MTDYKIDENVFEKIISPIMPLLQEAQESLQGDYETYTLSLTTLTNNLIFCIICRIKTIGSLVTSIKTDEIAKNLGLAVASKSMYSEAFCRYSPEVFRKIFVTLLNNCSFLSIPEIEQLGKILLIDGSLFPAIKTMIWAEYKKGANAIKLQMAFELNRMLPVEFLVTSGNYSEKKFLSDIIEAGVTYVCDRGYISFQIFKEICGKQAWFIIRGKNNMLYSVEKNIPINVPAQFLQFFKHIKDSSVTFINDTNQITYRIIEFSSMGENYILITNRFDLSTYEVIMLYAYRWQVELCFKYLKRTLTCIHLLSHDSKGIQIQFYLYMICYLLLLQFKQQCEIMNSVTNDVKEVSKSDYDSSTSPQTGRPYVCGIVSLLGERLKKFWKIGIHWLIAVRNFLFRPFSCKIAQELDEYT